MDKIKYYQAGHGNSVRGACHHQHRTVNAALKCAEQDQRDCDGLSGGSYSDRTGAYAVHTSGDITGPYDE